MGRLFCTMGVQRTSDLRHMHTANMAQRVMNTELPDSMSHPQGPGTPFALVSRGSY
jgi:hypothetical protein